MYISAKEAAKRWGISERRVRILCSEGRVDGVQRTSWAWNIPSEAPKPGDGRHLRHMKNHDLRIGGMDFSRLETEAQQLKNLADGEQFIRSYHSLVTRYILAAFANEGIVVQAQDLAVLYNRCFVPSLAFEEQILALNLRSILVRMLYQYGLGPIEGKGRPQMSEQRLKELYQMMNQGLEEHFPVTYPDGDKVLQMETLFVQYDRDWMHLHPVVRSLFLFGELLRIHPYGRYDGLLACLAFAQELLCNGYPPSLFDASHVDEFRAAMILTRSRGNYANVLRMLEQMLLLECSKLSQRE